MPRLRVLSASQVCRILKKHGFVQVRQSGSHIIMTKEGEMVTLSIPDHKEVARGTLRSLIRAANLTVDEFVAAI